MRPPDDVDLRIIKELGGPSSPQWNVRETYARIAKRVELDEETVRRRILRMREKGALPRWWMKPNPSVIGRQLAEIYVETPEDQKAAAISRIRKLAGVITIKDFLGPGMAMSLFYTDNGDLDRTVGRVVSTCGVRQAVVIREPIPRAENPMRKIDWKILRVMANDARMDLQDVAEMTGASLRTVQRRLATMMEGRAVFLSGRPDYGGTSGLFCDYLLYCAEPAKKRTMDARALSGVRGLVFSLTLSREYSTFVVSCSNPKEADETLVFLKGLDGAPRVRMGVLKELIHVDDWLSAEIAKRVVN